MGKDKKSKAKVLSELMEYMYEAKTRSEIWDVLYATEYEGESMDLNEAMAEMTDAEVFEWFPKKCAEYISKKIGIL